MCDTLNLKMLFRILARHELNNIKLTDRDRFKSKRGADIPINTIKNYKINNWYALVVRNQALKLRYCIIHKLQVKPTQKEL